MTYGCSVEYIQTGIFSKKEIKKPVEGTWEYWQTMKTYYPWNTIPQIWNLVNHADDDMVLHLDLAIVNRILAVTKG
ncbi:hypothetical protein D3C85_1016060 [compost metagenome]